MNKRANRYITITTQKQNPKNEMLSQCLPSPGSLEFGNDGRCMFVFDGLMVGMMQNQGLGAIATLHQKS